MGFDCLCVILIADVTKLCEHTSNSKLGTGHAFEIFTAVAIWRILAGLEDRSWVCIRYPATKGNLPAMRQWKYGYKYPPVQNCKIQGLERCVLR